MIRLTQRVTLEGFMEPLPDATTAFVPNPIRRKRREKADPSDQTKAARTRVSEHLKTVGKVLPAAPMTADELAAAWSLGQDDAYTLTVKVFRAIKGTNELVLIHEVELPDYSGRYIAANFGPGMYYLRPAAGAYAMKSAKVPVGDELARACGWGTLKPNAQDLVAARTLQKATEGPTDPADLLAAVERMLDHRLAALGHGPAMPIQGQVIQPVDPMAAMEREMERMSRMMTMMNGLQEKARETVRAEMGVTPPAAEDGSNLWLELAKIAAPVLASFMQARQEPAKPVQAAQPQPMALPGPVPPPAAPAAPVSAVPMLTPEEQAMIGQAVSMLRPFASHLVAMGKSAASDEQIAQELAALVPPALYDQIANLSALVGVKGAEVLNVVHPELGTDRWARILKALVIELTREDQE